jgi:N-acetylglucosaminyl-diphospho-decaprenol L-rhamnosyltransferase
VAACDAARAFLASANATVNVTVIDNDSEPESRTELKRLMPEGARLILSDTNLGFGAGANRTLGEGRAEFVCVSNADVIPDPGAIAALANFCRAHPRCGMVGPAFAEGSAYHAELPRAGALALRPLIGGFGHRPVQSPGPGTSIEVGQPAGACFLLKRQVWDRLGGFDEDYFLWYEDVDLARRLHNLRLRNYVCGDAVVRHSEGLATRTLSDSEHQKLRLKGLRLYLAKHHPRTGSAAAPLFALARRLRTRAHPRTG